MEEEREMREYEITFLIRDEGAISAVLSMIKQHGGEVGFEGMLKRITLAYRIRNADEAFWGYCHFRMAPSAVAALDRDLGVHAAVLRFLIITPPFSKTPQVVRKRREEGIREREPIAAKKPLLPLSNEDLEKKIDEILS